MKNVEIPKWLKGLPFAPEFRPTDTEFSDPIAYISKIEKEASAFGICKVIPPLPKPSKKYVLHNLNKSLSKCPDLGPDVNVVKTDNGSEVNTGGGEVRAVFTTRHQELGNSSKRVKGVGGNQGLGAQKQVWQSGEVYTFEQFEAKSKNFARSQLGSVKDVSPLAVEAMFWKAATEKPIYVEYANDVPGSGFGEPEGSFRYFHRGRRRRKRGTFDRNIKGSSVRKDEQVNTVNSNSVDADSCDKNNPNFDKVGYRDSHSFPSASSDESSLPNRRKSSSAGVDVEGTSGWKLSNSPWNLQVIARSPGSLTRFMPDDIPGVTSPMVYVGMLFSWFAWHVEDHELHSLNYLHMGSPKTWYAVPGDYAFAFEEVIRRHAYGGNTDRLAALTRLGEKTTLLSPEVAVASGIPCCRLVQNPGEFVVTFPRAYHVGFSHGFNCGEAANFGTPQWLAVAKEAAVRRAAMSYLPMLSHQQLLYLLTMSFVSRVPRSLLPGVRSSRLRDRQKEERELLVKRSFIEDILKENRLLTNLLQKSCSYRVVEWDLESLPSSAKGPDVFNSIDAVTTTCKENNSGNSSNQDLSTQMSLYMDSIDDFYVDDDDLLCDFQVDSGALPCVACGILGFPFMVVVQPSEEASKDLPKDYIATQNLGALRNTDSNSSSEYNCMVDGPVPDQLNCFSRNLVNDPDEASPFAQSVQPTLSLVDVQLPASDSVEIKIREGWNNSSGFLRPRIFCLEHATQTEELLRLKGGANVLVICHSDFRKIKAHLSVVAEEIGTPYSYEEIPFDDASQEDLNLIDLAIDSDEQYKTAEHWTSSLCINLLHCIQLRKKFPSMAEQHALTLSGLFSVTSQGSTASSLIWELRKSRSKRCSKHSVPSKLSMSIHMETHEGSLAKFDSPIAGKEEQIDKNEVQEAKSDCQTASKANKIIHYTRRRYKAKPFVSNGVSEGFAGHAPDLLTPQDFLVAESARSDENTTTMSVSTSKSFGDPGNSYPGPGFVASSGEAALQLKRQKLLPTDTNNNNDNHLPSIGADLLDAAPTALENIGIENGNVEMKELVVKDTGFNSKSHVPQMPEEVKAVEESNEKSQRGISENSAGSTKTADRSSEYSETTSEIRAVTRIRSGKVSSPLVSNHLSIQSKKHAEEDFSTDKTADASNLSLPSLDDPYVERNDKQMQKKGEYHLGVDGAVFDSPTLSDTVQQEIKNANGHSQKGAVSSDAIVIKESTSTVVIGLEVPENPNAAERFQHEDGNYSLERKTELEDTDTVVSRLTANGGGKRKRELDLLQDDQFSFNGFVKSPCEGLRPRTRDDRGTNPTDCEKPVKVQKVEKQRKDLSARNDAKPKRKGIKKGSHKCDFEGCQMSFLSNAELLLHKRNRCTYEECGKKFSSHKNLILHQRVHSDDRPLKCTWEGCTMSFKWAWARTEHLRVHTGERPYKCKVDGCGLTFRFVSDYSRHRRKTGHYVDKGQSKND